MHLYANQSGHFHQLLLENTENAEIWRHNSFFFSFSKVQHLSGLIDQ